MKVLHFYKTYHPDTFGGAEQAIQQICLATSSFGVSNTLLTLSPTAEPECMLTDSLSIVRVRRQAQIASMDIALAAIGKFKELAAQADVVHVHYPWPFMDAVLLVARCKTPVVVTYHSDIIRQKALKLIYSPLERWMLRRSNLLVATSPNYMASSENLRQFSSKTVAIPLALEEKSYPQDAVPLPAGLRPGSYMLFVGMLRYYKGLDALVEAAAGLPFPVVIAGEGPQEAQLQSAVKANGARNVQFLGRVSEQTKMQLLRECVAFVFPSNQRSEAFGVSLIEAAMCAKPMVTCEIGTGTSFVNVHGETGFVVPPNNPAKLRHALLQLWEDPILCAKLAKGARLRFEQEFTSYRMGKSYALEYAKLIASAKANA
jgi:O-antigen biosynthesis rhamnosyltransferase